MSYNKFKKYQNKKTYNKEFNKDKSIYLVIVESPSKCEKIESYLGMHYKCIASKGHLRQLDTYKKYELTYKFMDDKESHIKQMQSIINLYEKENIILATDDDREGEAIAWHICDIFNLPVETTKRITFNEITRSAIKESIENPKTISMSLVKSQQARQVLDVIVGFKISPFLWKYAYNNKDNSLSAGRCQTPALRLIYDNHMKKLENSKEHIYKISGYFTSKNLEFHLNKTFDQEKIVNDFLNKSIDFKYSISKKSKKDSYQQPPLPFNTSRLLQTASSILHYSPGDTMSLCQNLYQGGYITYMRTENKKYSTDFIQKAKDYIIKKYNDKYLGYTDDIENKDTSNPHEAIRVTNIELSYLSKDLFKNNSRIHTLYHFIWKNTIQSCMMSALYDSNSYEIDAPLETHYKISVEKPIFLGFKIVSQDNDSFNEELTKTNGIIFFLDTLSKEKTTIKYNKININEVINWKHSHYNESGLIKKLEDLEIGRPSTYAIFVDTIINRGYVKKQNVEGEKYDAYDYVLENGKISKNKKEKTMGNENNKLVLQPIGLLIIEFLIKHFEELFSYDYTKNMEKELDSIYKGILEDWTIICKDCESKIKTLAKPLKNLEKEIYKIDDNHDLIWTKNGPLIRKKIRDDEYELRNIKSNIKLDIEKLKNNEYSLEELLEAKDICLGKYENQDLYVKNGKYGKYAMWGENKKALNTIKKPLDKITLSEVIEVIQNDPSKNILREINENVSIRKGKYGAYVYYKRKDMEKPEFYNIKKFKEGFTYCDKDVFLEWLNTTYGVPLET